MKLAVLTSHVIQYQTPFFKKLAATGTGLMVYFCWNFGAKRTYDPQFQKDVEWDIPLLEGYSHKFLKNYSPKPSSEFWGQINFGAIPALAGGHYDVLLVYGWNSFTNIIAIIAAKLFGTKVLLHGENPLNQELMKPAWKHALKRFTFPILFSLVDAFLFIGVENRKFYEYYGISSKKLFFAPYAVDNERFMKEADTLRGERKKIRTSLGIKEKDFLILFTGKLMPKKRPGDLLKGFELFQKKYSNSHLFFVGDGELRSELEEYVHTNSVPNVHFEGFKNQTKLARYYTAADVFVLPSGIGETWGLVVNEAMCFGLPIIVSDVVGCASDLVHEGENGYAAPLSNREIFAKRLDTLARDGALRKRFSEASRRIIARYSHNEDVRGIISALARVSKGSRS